MSVDDHNRDDGPAASSAIVRWRCPIEGCDGSGMSLAIDVDALERGLAGIRTHIWRSSSNGHGMIDEPAGDLGMSTKHLTEYVEIREIPDSARQPTWKA